MAQTTTLPGKFKITLTDSEGNVTTKTISFSKGNLQYRHSTDEFKFADNQYDIIGSGNTMVGDDNYGGWIDLFGWGTAYNPYTKSDKFEDYSHFYEWGYNVIEGESKNWVTLTHDEWYYILYIRTPKPTYGTIVDGDYKIRGYFLIPDDWDSSKAGGLNLKDLYGKYPIGYVWDGKDYKEWDDNKFTLSEWNVLENSGIVFLPITGLRRVEKVDYAVTSNTDDIGNYDNKLPVWYGNNESRAQYWSSSESFRGKESTASYAFFSPDRFDMCDYGRVNGYAVRLARDINNTGITVDTEIVDENGNPVILYHTSKLDSGLLSGTTICTVDKSYAEEGTTETPISLYAISKKPYYIDLDIPIWNTTPNPTTNTPYKRSTWIGVSNPSLGYPNDLATSIIRFGEDYIYSGVYGWKWELRDTYQNSEICKSGGCTEEYSHDNEDLYLYMPVEGSISDVAKLTYDRRDCCVDDDGNTVGSYKFIKEDGRLTIEYDDDNENVDMTVRFSPDTTSATAHTNDLMWMYEYDGTVSFTSEFYALCGTLDIASSTITKDLDMSTQNSLFYLLSSQTFLDALQNKGYDALVGNRIDSQGTTHECVFLINNKKIVEIK